MKALLAALGVSFVSLTRLVAGTAGVIYNDATLEKLFLGEWQHGSHVGEYLADHTWYTNDQTTDKPRGSWHIKGGKLIKTYAHGRSAMYDILVINHNFLIIEDERRAKHLLTRGVPTYLTRRWSEPPPAARSYLK